MFLKLDMEEVMNIFLWLLYPSFVFELIRPRVCYGGLDIHDEYHLEIVATTELRDSIGVFPPFPFDI